MLTRQVNIVTPSFLLRVNFSALAQSRFASLHCAHS